MTATIHHLTHWKTRGNCHGADPEIFFPADTRSTRKQPDYEPARSYCRGCPVLHQCLEDELAQGAANQHGMRGGLTPNARMQILRTRQLQADNA